MTYLLDTHALAWFIDGDPRLSTSARAVIASSDSRLLVPVMVLIELVFLWQRQKKDVDYNRALDALKHCRTVTILPIDSALLDYLPISLNIHDAVIVATAVEYQKLFSREVSVVTRDAQIVASGLVRTFW